MNFSRSPYFGSRMSGRSKKRAFGATARILRTIMVECLASFGGVAPGGGSGGPHGVHPLPDCPAGDASLIDTLVNQHDIDVLAANPRTLGRRQPVQPYQPVGIPAPAQHETGEIGRTGVVRQPDGHVGIQSRKHRVRMAMFVIRSIHVRLKPREMS